MCALTHMHTCTSTAKRAPRPPPHAGVSRFDSPSQGTATTPIPTHGHSRLIWASCPCMCGPPLTPPAPAMTILISCLSPTMDFSLALLQALQPLLPLPMWSLAEFCHSLGLRGKERGIGRLFEVLDTCVRIYCHIVIIKFIYLPNYSKNLSACQTLVPHPGVRFSAPELPSEPSTWPFPKATACCFSPEGEHLLPPLFSCLLLCEALSAIPISAFPLLTPAIETEHSIMAQGQEL